MVLLLWGCTTGQTSENKWLLLWHSTPYSASLEKKIIIPVRHFFKDSVIKNKEQKYPKARETGNNVEEVIM